jgi:general secretion pathway protein G
MPPGRQRVLPPHGRRGAFTLIEVLIVVVIMAVIAGVVIPRVVDTGADAKQSTLKHNLHVMQSQIELYRLSHQGNRPAIQGDGLPQLTSATNALGEIGSSGPAYPFGPYVAAIPLNPFDGSGKVTAVASPGQRPTGVVGSLGGWQYDSATGAVWPNHAEYYR